jgi:hypothetical protein
MLLERDRVAMAMQPSSMRPPRSEPVVAYSDAAHVTGTFANVVISFSLAEPSRAYLDNWGATSKRLLVNYDHIAAMNVIDSTAKPPSDAIRVEINQLIANLSNKIVGIAIVVEGSGFVAAAKRSAMSMVTLMSRPPYPIRIFGDVTDAAAWLVSQLRQSSNPAKLDARSVAQAAETIRGQHAPRST